MVLVPGHWLMWWRLQTGKVHFSRMVQGGLPGAGNFRRHLTFLSASDTQFSQSQIHGLHSFPIICSCSRIFYQSKCCCHHPPGYLQQIPGSHLQELPPTPHLINHQFLTILPMVYFLNLSYCLSLPPPSSDHTWTTTNMHPSNSKTTLAVSSVQLEGSLKNALRSCHSPVKTF